MVQEKPPPYSLTTQANLTTPTTPTLAVTLSTDPTTNDVLVSLVPPREPSDGSGSGTCSRAPVDVCCVIDISGSMDTELKASLEEGKAAELTGLTTLDVVKHAVRTIVADMQPDDRLSIVTFSSNATVTAELTPMTIAGKAVVLQKVEDLRTQDSTNIWDGLKTGMNVLNRLTLPDVASHVSSAPASRARCSALFLLTDGMPNVNPPRGLIPMLKSYIGSHPLRFSIHTFGFGYSLDSQLLLQIARLGSGVYGFIPDASSLGAVIIHAVANLYSTCADQVELRVEYVPGTEKGPETASRLNFWGDLDATPYTWGTRIDVGTMQYGQTRDFICSMSNPQSVSASDDPFLSVTVRYRPWTQTSRTELLACTVSLSYRDIVNGSSAEARERLQYHSHRLGFIRTVDELFKPVVNSSQTFHAGLGGNSRPNYTPGNASASPDIVHLVISKLKATLSSLQMPPISSDPCANALAQDISGEVLLALSTRDIYDRWGRHYLPSLVRYHLVQQCGSYRDPGLQTYGINSPLFVASRDALDQTFDSLPQPKPSIKHQTHSHITTLSPSGARRGLARSPNQLSGGPPSPRHKAISSMSAVFASRSGPCFAGGCLITLEDGSRMPVRMLQRGVRVRTPKGAREVVAILKTNTQNGEMMLCELPGGLKITPWHPIKILYKTSGHWVFPINRSSPKLVACSAVYSLLLEPDSDPDAHGVYIQDVLCVTLGHGITFSPPQCTDMIRDVRTHEFLGNYRLILDCLSCFPVITDNGIFHLDCVLKNITGRICGFVPFKGGCSDISKTKKAAMIFAEGIF